MTATIVMGAQWGDEGKGKIIDYLSTKADYVVRYHGGNNAGHTVLNHLGKFPLHLVPSGIFSKAKACIAAGTVLDLEVLVEEIAMLKKAGIRLEDKLFISPRCHLILPYHKVLEKVYESAKGKGKTGSTGRGIGPVHADKVSYNGIRLADLKSRKQFSDKLAIQLALKNTIITAFGEKALRQKDIETMYLALFRKIKPYIQEPFPLLHRALQKKKHILFEGAHGVFLDNIWGTYPFATASTVVSGGVNEGAGIPLNSVTSIIGVVKAYTTRVGSGPFPTELFDKDGELLRKEGNEFGTTTGRPRRCGWFDVELIRFASQVSGFTEIAITKLDVLDSCQAIKICIGYKYRGKKIDYWDTDAVVLEKVTPIYQTLPGWMATTKNITSFEKLPKKAKQYIQRLEKYIGVQVRYISTGPKRDAIIKI